MACRDTNKQMRQVLRRAERGDIQAQYRLGLLYAAGGNVPQDLVSAHKWFNLAAVAGSGPARRERQELAAIMSAAEVAEAQRQAREWKAPA